MPTEPIGSPHILFEDEVRRVARLLWPAAQYSGATMVDGTERDGIFWTEECIHIMEATTSRKKLKAEEDTRKLARLANKYRAHVRERAVQCWFVTQDEPTADQRLVAARAGFPINVLSYSQFQSKLVDAASYLGVRIHHPFGSICDQEDGSIDPTVGYVDLDIVDRNTQKLWSVADITSEVAMGGRIVVLGDYGAGKSMTLREVFLQLRARYFRKESTRFPVYLNLREHHGQSDPSEILERHARQVGFGVPHHLVRAWKGGYVTLILDGFDEVTGLGILGAKRKLRESRYAAMEPIRAFIRNTPRGTGVAIAGRAHYFDNDSERRSALAMADGFVELSLNDFTVQQMAEYLRKSGCDCAMPEWMPARPLLVGYLAARRLLPGDPEAQRDQDTSGDPAAGWHSLLGGVCQREATIEAGVDGDAVRSILERLATLARRTVDGLGSLSPDTVVEAFKQVCGYAPAERALVLLKRLPGLGPTAAGDESRRFIDTDLADACRAGDVVSCIQDPFNFDLPVFDYAECTMDTIGTRVAALRLEAMACSPKKSNAAVERVSQRSRSAVLLSDLCRVAMELGHPIAAGTYVSNVLVGELDLGPAIGDQSRLEFQECYFTRVVLDSDTDASHLPRFRSCYITELDGRVSLYDLPPGVFDEMCTIDSFPTGGASTDAILELDLPLGTRVVLTMLRKVYLRRGRGRRESALLRGLDHTEQRLVPDALRLLRTHRLIVNYRRGENTVWLPVRSQSARVSRMVLAPSTTGDPLLDQASHLG